MSLMAMSPSRTAGPTARQGSANSTPDWQSDAIGIGISPKWVNCNQAFCIGYNTVFHTESLVEAELYLLLPTPFLSLNASAWPGEDVSGSELPTRCERPSKWSQIASAEEVLRGLLVAVFPLKC